MGFLSFLDPTLNFAFGPLLKLDPLLIVLILSLLISLIIVVIYKYTTDQNLMKQLKDEIKEFQREMRTLRDDPKKAMEVQKKATQTNMKYMMHSLKPTLITFIPIILIFGWLQGHLAYEPLLPGKEFSVVVGLAEGIEGKVSLNAIEGITITGEKSKEISNGEAIFTMKGEEGDYLLEFSINDKSYTHEVLIKKNRNYVSPVKNIRDETVNFIRTEHKPLKVLNLFGWKIGWLGAYIIFSVVFSMLLRKFMKVY